MRSALAVFAVLLLVGCGKADNPLPYSGPRIVAPADTTVAPTGSMAPTFKGGERIHISPIDIRDVKPGDIIVAYWDGTEQNAMHRVIAVRNVGGVRGLVTKGDANMERDAHITTAAELVGIVREPVIARR